MFAFMNRNLSRAGKGAGLISLTRVASGGGLILLLIFALLS